jgi:hypothetical protein
MLITNEKIKFKVQKTKNLKKKELNNMEFMQII